ncbi:hypothetical protein OQA88_11636 [Cercophora sp. LCS_1]
MAPRCEFCAGLTISRLIELDDEGDDYRHHPSFSALEQSADDGCELCRLIIECSKRTQLKKHEFFPFLQHTICELDGHNDSSIYARAKRLNVSPVAVGIRHLEDFSLDTPRKPYVHHGLSVRIGKDSVRDAHATPNSRRSSSSRDQTLLSFGLRIRVPRERELCIDGVQVGSFQLDHNLGSQANHDIARRWLQDCSTHLNCRHDEPSDLPTRVIDVGAGSHDNAARLIHSHGTKGAYVALSHCWGGRVDVTLNSRTIGPFQKELTLDILPANFRDAIIVTRQLGFRYLWIDCLCIIQDSVTDWELESQKMDRVYGNAALTISAIAAGSSDIGLLTTNIDSRPWPKSASLPVSSDSEDKVDIWMEDPDEESLSQLCLDGPLARRGWCLQESVLSRRILFYGKHQIYWKCLTSFLASDGLCFESRKPSPFQCMQDITVSLQKELALSTSCNSKLERVSETSNHEQVLVEYYDLVEEYSRRQLSLPTDKFPAFSGLARRLSPTFGDYLAGIWAANIHRGLLWHMSWAGRFCRHVDIKRSPSWSWAVTDEAVAFVYKHWPLHVNAPESHMTLEILSHEITPKNERGNAVESNWYGQIESGRLVVEGLTIPLIRSSQKTRFTMGPPTEDGQIWFDEPLLSDMEEENGLAFSYRTEENGKRGMLSMNAGTDASDSTEIDWEAYMERGYLLLLVHANASPDTAPSEVERQTKVRPTNRAGSYCLAIRRTAKGGAGGTFERFGMAILNNPATEDWSAWERRCLTLV